MFLINFDNYSKEQKTEMYIFIFLIFNKNLLIVIIYFLKK